jgi:hypothetical protein
VPRVRAVARVLHQRLEKRRRQTVEITLRFTDDVPGHELRRVLEHVDEAVQLAQDVVRDVLRGARFAVEVDRNVGVANADLADELAQLQHRRAELGAVRDLFVVDRQNERTRAALLLRERGQIAIARRAYHIHAFLLDRAGQRPHAQARAVLAAVILVDDDDREVKALHRGRSRGVR